MEWTPIIIFSGDINNKVVTKSHSLHTYCTIAIAFRKWKKSSTTFDGLNCGYLILIYYKSASLNFRHRTIMHVCTYVQCTQDASLHYFNSHDKLLLNCIPYISQNPACIVVS